VTEPPTFWVRSELLPNGTYGVGISVGDDRAWVLSRDRAVAYVVACFARATEADHDAATYALLCSIGIPADTAGRTVVADVRPSCATDDTATEPLRFIPSLGLKVGPFLRMTLDGRPAGELTPADLRDHAAGVLNVLAAADLDANLHRVLVGQYRLDDATARGVVGELANHWPTPQTPRSSSDA
jgi:hypothetical protein